jgi:hypothetical protein
MKTIRGVCVAALLLTSAMSAQASEYQHFKGGPNWRAAVIEFIHRYKASPETITGGITGDFDVHVYLVPGQFTGAYTLVHFRHPPGRALNTIKALVDGGTAKILGFFREDVYVLTWTKPTN